MIRPHGPRPTRERNLRVRAAAAASAIFWTYFFFGIIDLLVPLDQTAGFYDSYLLETGWGLTYTFLVGAAFLSLTVRPSLTMPLIQVALVALCLGVTAVASGSLGQLVPALLLVLNAYGFSYLARGPLRLPPGWYRPPVDPVLAILAIFLLPLAVAFAVDMIAGYRTGRPPTDDDTWGLDHWPTQAALALVVVAAALAVAAGVRGRWTGTAVCAGCIAVTAGWFGVVSAIYPEHAGSIGERWGVAVLAWSVVFAVAVGWRWGGYQGSPVNGLRASG